MEKDFVEFDREKFTIVVHLQGGNDLIIGKNDVEISYFSGGPGGQNVNKNMNGVRLIYRIPEEFRMNVLKTQELVSRSISQRKREQNLALAFEQLAYKARRYFYVKPERKQTHIPKSVTEKRLSGKKMHGRKKELRDAVRGEE